MSGRNPSLYCGGGRLLCRGLGKRVDGVFSGRPQSFRHHRLPVDDCSSGRGGMAQNGRTRGGTFHDKIDRCRESQGWIKACSRMPEQDGKDQEEVVAVVDSNIQRIVLAMKKLRRQKKSAIDLSNANPACGHEEARRSTGYIMVTIRYSDQEGSRSRQKVMRLYKQRHRPMSKRLIKPPYSISRATSIDSDCCFLPTTSVLSNKANKLRFTQFSSMMESL